MALSANTIFEVRTGGSDTNGGGFVAGASGTDWSQQDSPQYSVTDGVTAGTTTITSATANFGTDVVGNLIYVQGGTGSVVAGWYQITARGSATSITVDRSTGLSAGTGVTLKVGGALATPGGLGAVLAASGVSGMLAYLRSGTYTLANSVANTSGGPFSAPPGTRVTLEGYGSARGDLGTKPVVHAGAQTGVNLLASANATGSAGTYFVNIEADGNNGLGNTGFHLADTDNRAINCVSSNCPGNGFSIGWFQRCRAIACGNGFSSGRMAQNCTASGCTTGFVGTNHTSDCLAYGNSGVGFTVAGAGDSCNCTSYGNGSHGFAMSSSSNTLSNCIAASNGGSGYSVPSNNVILVNCADYNNTSGRLSVAANANLDYRPIALSANPFVDAASGDFRPNDTAGGGALLRGMGLGVYGQADNRDVGAVQHADSGGAAPRHPLRPRVWEVTA